MSKIRAYGSKLKLGDGASPEAFTEVPGLKDFVLPTGEADNIDVTAHDSPGRTREYIAGFLDTGEIEIEFYYDPANAVQDDLRELKESGEENNFQVVLPDDDATTFEFAATVNTFEIAMPVEDALTATCSLKITGEVSLAA